MQNMNLANIDQILQVHGIDINSIPENQKRFHLMTVEEIKRLYEKNEILNNKLTLVEASMLNMQNRQNTADQHIANANGAINNTNARLNALDARVTLTEQNLNLLKDRVNTMAEQAIRNGDIPNPVKPGEGEEALLKNILGDTYYQDLKLNYMIVTRDEIAKAAKEVINQAILACRITNVISEERANYRTRNENRNTVAREGQRIEQETREVENGLQNLDSDRAAQRGRIADSVRRGQVTNAALVSYDQQTEEMRGDLETRRKKIKSDADLHEKDVEKLESEFVSTLRRIGANGSYVKEIIELTGVAINVADSIKKYVERKEAQARQEERFKVQANQLERELIAMTTDGRKETFDKANAIYLARYYATLGRDDVSYEATSVWPSRSGIKKYSNIPHYEEFYNLQSFLNWKKLKYVKKLEKIFPNDPKPNDCSKIIEYVKQKNYLLFIREDKTEEFKIKYQLYRAYRKEGEFFDIKECGDSREIFILHPIFQILSIPFIIDREINEYKWSKNIPNLKEIMKMYLVVAERLEDILKTKCVYARIKYYNDWTKSEYGKDLLKKNEKVLDSEFPNNEAKEKFAQCFDLYQKISNEGIANQGNYANYTFEYATAAILLARQEAAQRAEAAT